MSQWEDTLSIVIAASLFTPEEMLWELKIQNFHFSEVCLAFFFFFCLCLVHFGLLPKLIFLNP